MDRKRKGTLNRALVGVILLGGMLVAGLVCAASLSRHHSAMAADLEEAAWAALSEDWDTAQTLATTTRQKWRKSQSLITTVADHRPMDEIQALLDWLPVYLARRDPGEFAAVCAELSSRLSTLAQSHQLNLQNLL